MTAGARLNRKCFVFARYGVISAIRLLASIACGSTGLNNAVDPAHVLTSKSTILIEGKPAIDLCSAWQNNDIENEDEKP